MYEKAGKYAEEGTLEKNIEELRQEYQKIAENARKEIEAITSISGTSPDQQATYNSLEKWTYDQADELISRATATQIIGEHIHEGVSGMFELQTLMQQDISLVRSDVSIIRIDVDKLIELQQSGNERLVQIADHTAPIGEIRDLVKKLYNEM